MSHHPSRRLYQHPVEARDRHGVILLVVLSMLALFTLLVLTFVIYASQHKKTALAVNRANRYDDASSDLLTRAAMQIIRGADNPISVVGCHSLLEDMYGNDSVRGLVSGFRATAADYSTSFYGRDSTQGGVITMMYFDTPLVGADGQPGRAGIDDDSMNGVDDAGELGWLNTDDLKLVNGFYNGRVLTMIDGPAAGKSTRITGYVIDTASGYARFVMLPLEGMGADTTVGAAGVWLPQNAPVNGNTFLINGRPFSGSGFGYNYATGRTDAVDVNGRPRALLPFPPPSQADISNSNWLTDRNDHVAYTAGPDGTLGTRDDRVCANEDYDAYDYQNMIVAGRIWNSQRRRWEVVLPSFVRPDLIMYWVNHWDGTGTPLDMTALANQREVLKRTFPRPLNLANDSAYGHALFTGSNPLLTSNLSALWSDASPANGVIDAMDPASANGILWDVDNDGDGRPDSVWTDFGFPVQTAADGRRYKPLVAALVLDMDNKLNINAHGTPYHFATSGGSEVYIGQNQFTGPYAGGGAYTTPKTLPVGSGASAAEINLSAILPAPYTDNNGATINEYRRLLMGGFPWDSSSGAQNTSRPIVDGRYGESFLYSDGSGRFPLAGITSSSAAVTNGPDGVAGTADDVYDGDNNYPISPMGFVTGTSIRAASRGNFSIDGFFPGTAYGAVGSPGDPDGNGAVALDLAGQPFYNLMGAANSIPGYSGPVGEAFNEPFEIDLSPQAQRYFPGAGGTSRSIDNPFTAQELEAVLRYFDQDATTLPNRIGQLAPATVSSRKTAGSITTESWDLPCPSVHWTEAQRQYLAATLGNVPTNLHITDLYALKLLVNNPTLTVAQVNSNLGLMMPPELAAGLRINLNRPLGNGADDNANGVVDEPVESIAGSGEPVWGTTAAGGTSALGGAAYLNQSNDATFANRYLARQILARHLYCLAMLMVDSGYVEPVTEAGLDADQKRELMARRIAQWAVNVVDFRDRDSIMTPFEYDVFPFVDANGDGVAWDVDGWVGFNAATGAASVDDTNLIAYPHRRLVWGCEHPDLLLTETAAFHDIRTEDLASGGGRVGAGDTGNNYDQQYIPIGSAFIELYCTRNANNSAYLGDLYRNNGSLDLGKMAPSSSTGAYPVWRLAISYGILPETGANAALAGNKNDVATRLATYPDSTTLQPENFNALGPASIPSPASFMATPAYPSPKDAYTTAATTARPANQLATAATDSISIERIVWFSSVAPAASNVDKNKIYYNFGPGAAAGATDVLLGPGKFAVVGPYRQPDLGGPKNFTTFGPSTAASKAQEIWLGGSAASSGSGGRSPVKVAQIGGSIASYPTSLSAGTGDIQEPLGIAVAGNPVGTPNAAAGWTSPIPFSISEPLFSSATYYPKPPFGFFVSIVHYDGSSSTVFERYTTVLGSPLDASATRPLGATVPTIFKYGTQPRYKSVFLQRLADPTQAWNPQPTAVDPSPAGYDATKPVNPYLTVDWMPIDLTVFNSIPKPAASAVDPTFTAAGTAYAATRQRGDNSGTYNLWKQPNYSTWLPAPTGISGTTNQILGLAGTNLSHSLGYLNVQYQSGASSPKWITSANLSTVANGYSSSYIGAPLPSNPAFPWMTWNNRPYNSSMEILSVPASGPGRLLHEYDIKAASDKQYAPKRPGIPGVDAVADPFAPYPHLLNLFSSSNTAASYNPTLATAARANLHRIFDYITVPSRFSGTEEVLNPGAYWETSLGSLPFHPPFNTVSRYRDPGRVNINTVLDDGLVWRGIMNDYPGAYPGGWQQLLWSRRGYGTVPGSANAYPDALQYSVNSPTIFANPFRSYGNNHNVPIAALKNRAALTTATGAERDLVEAGLLRPLPSQTDGVGTTTAPTDPLFATAFTESYRSTDRNPAFRYQPLQKLDNLLTTRSNAYAIWITIGCFEVSPVAADAVHPEGVSLGAELGADSGQIQRRRAFYLFDRTIPVGFQRGLDLNVDKAILLRRIIE